MASKLSCTMADAYGRTTKRVFGMETQATLADYITAAAAFVAALEDVTDLSLQRSTFLIDYDAGVFDVTAGANVDVGATASGWVADAVGKKASMRIPGIKPALVSADGSVAITSVVATFLALFEDEAAFNLSDGEQIEAWIKARLDR
jgi:hypothetical protein